MSPARIGRVVGCASFLCCALPVALAGAPVPPPPALPVVAPPAQPVPHSVTFLIDMRAEIEARRFDPATDAVGVRGGVAPLSWNTTLRAEDPEADGTYEVKVTFPRAP